MTWTLVVAFKRSNCSFFGITYCCLIWDGGNFHSVGWSQLEVREDPWNLTATARIWPVCCLTWVQGHQDLLELALPIDFTWNFPIFGFLPNWHHLKRVLDKFEQKNQVDMTLLRQLLQNQIGNISSFWIKGFTTNSIWSDI